MVVVNRRLGWNDSGNPTFSRVLLGFYSYGEKMDDSKIIADSFKIGLESNRRKE
jgi:hypothetical protein